MANKTLLTTGIAGSIIAALCCATPVLVILLGALGLSAWLGWIDYAVLPVLAICVGITAYALSRGTTSTDTAAGGGRLGNEWEHMSRQSFIAFNGDRSSLLPA
jgi:mercuric ion transport protein